MTVIIHNIDIPDQTAESLHSAQLCACSRGRRVNNSMVFFGLPWLVPEAFWKADPASFSALPVIH